MAQFTDLPFRTMIVDTQANVPHIVLNANDFQYITVHQTANPRPGMDAEAHAVFVRYGGGVDNVSFHFAVDDHEAIQILECWRIGYHAGDGCDNRQTDLGCFQSLAIETCENSDGDWTQTKINLSKLITMIVEGDDRIIGLRPGAYSYDRVVPHQRWSGKYCPHTILDEGSLPYIIAQAKVLGSPMIEYGISDYKLQELLGDQNHISINGARVYRFRDWIAYEHVITPRQKAIRTSIPIGPDIPAHTPIQTVAFIAQANGDKWFLGKDNARYLMTEQTFTVL